MSKNSPIGSSWDDFEKETFTIDEIAESDLIVSLIDEIIPTRYEQEITQKELKKLICSTKEK